MHVIDAHPPYHVLLGLPWIHRAVPSTYFQCIKALIRAVPVHIDAVSLPFEEHETYFMDASFYGEFAKEGEYLKKVYATRLPLQYKKGKERKKEE